MQSFASSASTQQCWLCNQFQKHTHAHIIVLPAACPFPSRSSSMELELSLLLSPTSVLIHFWETVTLAVLQTSLPGQRSSCFSPRGSSTARF
jgi:hypothetical protein